jgi:hypothetical protein
MHLNDLLRLNGRPFIEAAYFAVLKRQVEPQGLDHYMARLALGDGKESVIIALATSREATGSAIEIEGLKQLLKRHRRSGWRRAFQRVLNSGQTPRQIARIEHMIAVQHQEVLNELARFRDLQAMSANLGAPKNPVLDTLRNLQEGLAHTARDPKAMVKNFQRIIRSSALADKLG